MRTERQIFYFAVFVVLIAIAIFIYIWQFRKARRMLQDWALQNGYQLIEAEYRWIIKGPFFWKASRGQSVYRIVIVTREGYRHAGWARCGGFWFGLLTKKVTAIWDGQPPYAAGGFPVIPIASIAPPKE